MFYQSYPQKQPKNQISTPEFPALSSKLSRLGADQQKGCGCSESRQSDLRFAREEAESLLFYQIRLPNQEEAGQAQQNVHPESDGTRQTD